MDNYELLLSKEAEENIDEAIATLVSAAQDIANKSEQDFERIKEKKWYKRLWELVTFSKDNEKIQARGVANLAKLNEIVMKAIVLLSKQSKNNADRIYEALQKIKSLTEDVSDLFAQQEAIANKILIIRRGFESEGRFDELSDNQRAIICAVLDRFSEIGSNEHTQDLMATVYKSARRTYDEVTYRIIEKELNTSAQKWLFNLLHGYSLLLTNEMADEKHDAFRHFPLSDETKENIRKAVKMDVNQRLGIGNYIRLFEVQTTSEDDFVVEDDIEWLFYEEDESEKIPQKEDVYITSLTQIRSGESLKFIDKNVYIQANIDCHGELLFLNCNVFYNCGDALGKITLSPDSQFNVWNSRVECCAYDDTAFVRGRETEIYCMNSTFHKCSRFIEVSASEVTIDRCGVYNCIRNFVSAGDSADCSVENALVVIDDLDAVAEDMAYQKEHKGAFLPHIFDIDWCDYSNNLFYCPVEFNASLGLTVFWGKRHIVESCTFITLGHQSIHYSYSPKTVNNCLFVGGSNIVSLDGQSELNNSMFIGCRKAISCGKDAIKNCRFVDCVDTSIEAQFSGNTVIQDCLFMNTKVVAKKQKGKYEDEIGPCIKLYCDREFMEKGTNKPNLVTGCTFYNLNNYDFIIAPAAVNKPEDVIAKVERCHFANCECKSAIQTGTYYYSSILEIKKKVRDVIEIVNCQGVDPYGWRNGSGKTISQNEVNVNLTETAYGCEYLNSVFYLNNGLVSDEKLRPWIAAFEQRVIAELE